MIQFPRHALPLSLVTHNGAGPKEIRGASAGLLWIDRPFAVSCARVLGEFLQRIRSDDTAKFCLGRLVLDDLPARIISMSHQSNLGTIHVDPDELDAIDDDVSFYNPLRWPPKQVRAGDELIVMGYPIDQWPAALTFRYCVEQTGPNRFEAKLLESKMPGRLQGICGAPVYRVGSPPEFVGIVVESMFHNERIEVQHASSLDQCGRVMTFETAAQQS